MDYAMAWGPGKKPCIVVGCWKINHVGNEMNEFWKMTGSTVEQNRFRCLLHENKCLSDMLIPFGRAHDPKRMDIDRGQSCKPIPGRVAHSNECLMNAIWNWMIRRVKLLLHYYGNCVVKRSISGKTWIHIAFWHHFTLWLTHYNELHCVGWTPIRGVCSR